MKITNDTTGLITHDSIVVTPQELNDDAGWALVQSKKTRKEIQKAKEEDLAAFPPLPSIQKDDESVAKLSEKSSSSSKCSMKLKLNKIFNNNKNNKSNKCVPKEVVVTKNDVKHNNINQEYDEVIRISSSDSDIFDNISIMSAVLQVWLI